MENQSNRHRTKQIRITCQITPQMSSDAEHPDLHLHS